MVRGFRSYTRRANLGYSVVPYSNPVWFSVSVFGDSGTGSRRIQKEVPYSKPLMGRGL